MRFFGPFFRCLLVHPSWIIGIAPSVFPWFSHFFRTTNHPQRRCVLSLIAVSAEYRGRGVGKQLVRAFVDRAKGLKAETIFLETLAKNNEAVNAFYQGLGFRAVWPYGSRNGKIMNNYYISVDDMK